jgi:hypothetical protein
VAPNRHPPVIEDITPDRPIERADAAE